MLGELETITRNSWQTLELECDRPASVKQRRGLYRLNIIRKDIIKNFTAEEARKAYEFCDWFIKNHR